MTKTCTVEGCQETISGKRRFCSTHRKVALRQSRRRYYQGHKTEMKIKQRQYINKHPEKYVEKVLNEIQHIYGQRGLEFI